jgi:hypothetical protein
VTADEYATLVYYWGSAPEPGRVAEICLALETAHWAQGPEKRLPVAGVVLAFATLYPGLDLPIVSKTLVDRCRASLAVVSQEDPTWCDFHIAQWFVMRDTVSIDSLLDRVADGGTVGYEARSRINTVSMNCIPFGHALEAGQVRRHERMIVNVRQ